MKASYKPVFQGDNAGPHIDAAYLAGIKGHCETKGWYWEPQASQMPHMNVLDLSVFPCMSRRHIQKARECGGRRCCRRMKYGKTPKMYGKNYQTQKWPPHVFKLTGLQTNLSKQKAITNFLAQVGASIVGSEMISNLPKMVLNELIRRRLVLPIISYNYAFILTTKFILASSTSVASCDLK
jgi:hypothetical protein